jgi:tRNA pseudouridine13 synthase
LWNKVASFRIEKYGRTVVKGDLVLEDPAHENVGRNRAPRVKVVTDDDVTASRYSIEDIVLPLIGANTRDPDNECSQAFDEALKTDHVSRDRLINVRDRDLHCVGDYRKVICRPTDIDYEILRYSDELQPLIETDYMKINGIAIAAGDSNNEAQQLWGMRVGFSLPSSSYATIFLRELMKKPTSSAYQKTLGLGNETPSAVTTGSSPAEPAKGIEAE